MQPVKSDSSFAAAGWNRRQCSAAKGQLAGLWGRCKLLEGAGRTKWDSHDHGRLLRLAAMHRAAAASVHLCMSSQRTQAGIMLLPVRVKSSTACRSQKEIWVSNKSKYLTTTVATMHIQTYNVDIGGCQLALPHHNRPQTCQCQQSNTSCCVYCVHHMQHGLQSASDNLVKLCQ